MNVLPEAFDIASISGLWLPIYWKSSWSRLLYRAYTCFTVAIMSLIIISQLVALTFLSNSVDELVEATYLFLTAVNAVVKALNILIRRQSIIELMDMFADLKCLPRNADESRLCAYFDKISRYMVLSCMGLGGCSVSFMAVWPLFVNGDDYILSIRGWQPYAITNALGYSITQAHQMLAIITMLLWNCSNDLTCSGFMIQICSQIRLMCHRLKDIPGDASRQRQLVKQSVQHHLHIFEIKRRLEMAYTPAILSQYLLSSLVLCLSIYQLTTNRSDIVQTSVMLLYMSAIAIELMLYCWFGNDISVLSIKFAEIVCQSNWTKLHISNRRGLLIMMLRSSLPIQITCGPLITLSTDTSMRILKLSYSAFNVLHRSH